MLTWYIAVLSLSAEKHFCDVLVLIIISNIFIFYHDSGTCTSLFDAGIMDKLKPYYGG